MKYLSITLVGILALAVGFFVGFHTGRQSPTPITGQAIRDNSGNYQFINPLIGFSLGPKTLFSKYTPLENELTSYINSEKAVGDIASTSIYFRDLNSDEWTGVNEDAPYSPSSMLKVIVMMAYYSAAESNPAILNETFNYKPQYDSEQDFVPATPLTAGPQTVQNLINNMIITSDDDAYISLVENDTQGKVAAVNTSLRLPSPTTNDISNDYMSAHAYSLVFRALYNATYLSADDSEQALKLLTETTFNAGLIAGVPANTVVAHKFGERTQLDTNGNLEYRELHDCGIIYAPSNPYLLCVMTKGSDFTKLSAVIAHISSITYNYVENKK
ncbi:MAG TPA: serine hydrolase [Candidatus Paceibacterota bacterium]|nr:serine hydrolase [Candidatus Paceibacterota bacterium]